MSSPGWATVGRTASGESFFTLSMNPHCARSVRHLRRGQSVAESQARVSLGTLEDWIREPVFETGMMDAVE
jgi:hypothetical protein